MALSPAEAADFQSSVLRRKAFNPQAVPDKWLKCLQRAIYDWAHATGRVWALRFRQYRLRARLAEPPPFPSKAPQHPFPARGMLSSVERFTRMAHHMPGTSVTAFHALKRTLWPWGRPIGNKSSGKLSAGPSGARRKPGTSSAPRSSGGRSNGAAAAPPRDVSEIPLDSKALLNPRETLSALYLSRQRLQGHSYRIRDDPDRWAHFQRYLGLLPRHAPPARGDYVQPRHLWEV